MLLSQDTNIVSRDIYSTSRDDFWQDFLRLIYAALLPQHIAAASLTADNWRGTRPQCGFLFPAAPDAIAYGMCVLEFVLVAMLSTEETLKYGFEGCAGADKAFVTAVRQSKTGAKEAVVVAVRHMKSILHHVK